MIDMDEVMFYFGMIVAIIGVIVAIITAIKLCKKMINEYKYNKKILVGVGVFLIIYFIIDHIKDVLMYG